MSSKHGSVSCLKTVPLRFNGDDEALAAALKAKHPGAMEALFDRYGSHVQRVLVRVLGFDRDLCDLIHEVFIAAFTNAKSIRGGRAIKSWLTTLAVYTARQCIRRRTRRRAYWRQDIDTEMDVPMSGVDPEEIEALRLTYQVLDKMPDKDRIVFSLRFIEGMEIAEVADACRVSVSTAKRRLKRAQVKFTAIARRFPILVDFMEQGGRWRTS